MLQSLSIRNFAIIDRWDVEFQSGETAVTGETGAGKSIFVDALRLLRGDKASKTVLRPDGTGAMVEGAFYVDDSISDKLLEYGIETEEGLLILQRTVTEKSSQIRINQRVQTLQTLREISSLLFDVHAQNSQTVLSNKKYYLSLVDRFGQEGITELRSEIASLLRELRSIETALEQLDLFPDAVEREKEVLAFQIKEIEDARLSDYDEENLNQEYRALTTAVERADMVNRCLGALQSRDDGTDGPIDTLNTISKHLLTMSDQAAEDEALEEMKDRSYQIQSDLEYLSEQMQRYLDMIDIDPARVQEIDQVFTQVMRLKRKYGSSIDEILQFLEESKTRMELLDQIEERRSELEKKRATQQQALQRTANSLSDARETVARAMEQRIAEELVDMNIKKLEFQVKMEKRDTITEDGQDIVDFMISTNPGEPMRSVSEVASGGEMSRFMLAFKIVAAEYDEIDLMVFDEIDTGISGRTAQIVGEKILDIAKDRQVICITHLPQIAALANQHHLIYKVVDANNRTTSHMALLEGDARIEEQARLIGGVNITDVTRAHAKEMLLQANALR